MIWWIVSYRRVLQIGLQIALKPIDTVPNWVYTYGNQRRTGATTMTIKDITPNADTSIRERQHPPGRNAQHRHPGKHRPHGVDGRRLHRHRIWLRIRQRLPTPPPRSARERRRRYRLTTAQFAPSAASRPASAPTANGRFEAATPAALRFASAAPRWLPAKFTIPAPATIGIPTGIAPASPPDLPATRHAPEE